MAHHLDNRRVNRRMIAQEIRASIVGGEHDRIAIRQVIIQHREALTAPARPRAKPDATIEAACCCASPAYQQTLSATSPDGYPADQKRHREVGQIVIHRQHVIGQIRALFRPMSNHRVLLAGFSHTSR